jgi:hypothetical protein
LTAVEANKEVISLYRAYLLLVIAAKEAGEKGDLVSAKDNIDKDEDKEVREALPSLLNIKDIEEADVTSRSDSKDRYKSTEVTINNEDEAINKEPSPKPKTKWDRL